MNIKSKIMFTTILAFLFFNANIAKAEIVEGKAEGSDSIAIGTGSSSKGESSIAIGKGSASRDIGGIAIGDSSLVQTDAVKSISIGYNSQATGKDSISIGADTQNSPESISIGNSSTGQGGQNVVVGYSAKSVGRENVAIGHTASSSREGVAIGSLSKSSREGAIAIGKGSLASGYDAIAIGRRSKVEESSGVALGQGAEVKANAYYSVAIGDGSFADESKVVSFKYRTNSGGKAFSRRLVGVDKGKNDTDAVNLSQLKEYVSDAMKAKESEVFVYGSGNIKVSEVKQKNGNKIYTIDGSGLADNKLSNLAVEGKKVITDLVDIKGEGEVSVESKVDETTGKKTSTISLNKDLVAKIDKIDSISDKLSGISDIMQKDTTKEEINKVDSLSRNGIALAMAMAGLPQSNAPISIFGGFGLYKGSSAFALGLNGKYESVRYRVNGAISTNRDLGLSLGIGYEFGKEEPKNKLEQLEEEIQMLKAELRGMKK